MQIQKRPARQPRQRPRAVHRVGGLLAGVVLLAVIAEPAHGGWEVPARAARISVASDGTEADGDSRSPDVSKNGRYVVFQSEATNLVSGDTNGEEDVFLHDRATGTTSRVSVRSDGAQADGRSYAPSISADGRTIAFVSAATNLDSRIPDTNAASDVFIHDTVTGETSRVSVRSNGAEGNGFSTYPFLAARGNVVAFDSAATNLDNRLRDTNGLRDVFVHDIRTGETTRVSIHTDGDQASGGQSIARDLSGDGRVIAFESTATNLVDIDGNGASDVFTHDLDLGTTELVSRPTGGTTATGDSFYGNLSGEGRYVVFGSLAENLDSEQADTNGTADVFLHDRTTGVTTRVSKRSNGDQAIGDGGLSGSPSSDGQLVAFLSRATNLSGALDSNDDYDVFVHNTGTGTTSRVSQATDRADGRSFDPVISGNGDYVVFASAATNLDEASADTNGVIDIFIATNLTCNGLAVTVDLDIDQSPTSGDDVIMGTRNADTINGLRGRDSICGGRGDDIIDGGRGDDFCNGGKGQEVDVTSCETTNRIP